MSYTVWIMVDGDDDQGTYWSVDAVETRQDAIDRAQEIAEDIYVRTGSRPDRLED